METTAAQYCSWDPNAETRNEISQLKEANDIEKLSKLLSKRLAFGTAGLRGPMGAGYSCMNDLVILQTTQGLIRYMENTHGADAKSMVTCLPTDYTRCDNTCHHRVLSLDMITAVVELCRRYHLRECVLLSC